jgi:hypothetical protein
MSNILRHVIFECQFAIDGSGITVETQHDERSISEYLIFTANAMMALWNIWRDQNERPKR